MKDLKVGFSKALGLTNEKRGSLAMSCPLDDLVPKGWIDAWL